MARISCLVEVAEGDVLIDEGTDSDEIGYILRGALGMVKTLEDGRSHIIGLLVPHGMYGRIFNGALSYRVEAISDSQLLKIRRDAFERILQDAPEIERRFLVEVLDELDAAREWILLLGGRRIVERLASFLLILSRQRRRDHRHAAPARPDGPDPFTLRIPLKRSDLARHLGTRPETLSRALHELEDDRVLRIVDPYKVEITDFEGLVDIAGHDLTLDS